MPSHSIPSAQEHKGGQSFADLHSQVRGKRHDISTVLRRFVRDKTLLKVHGRYFHADMGKAANAFQKRGELQDERKLLNNVLRKRVPGPPCKRSTVAVPTKSGIPAIMFGLQSARAIEKGARIADFCVLGEFGTKEEALTCAGGERGYRQSSSSRSVFW